MIDLRQRTVRSIAGAVGAGLRQVDRYVTGSVTGTPEEDLQANPYPSLAAMRARGRVLRSFSNRGWWVLGHAEAQAAFKDSRLSSDLRNNPMVVRTLRLMAAGDRIPTLDDPTLLTLDAPDHTRLRKLSAQGFLMKRIMSLEPSIRRLTDECLQAIHGERTDLVDVLAKPLPAIVIAELLGLPVADRRQFQAWSDDLLGLTQLNDPPRMQQAIRSNTALIEYLATIVEAKRAHPGQDLISHFIAAEEQGDQLSADEIYSTCSLLLSAGHETTTRLIGNGLHALLTNPEQFERLRRDPSLIPNAVEEMLRFDPAVQWMPRTVTENFDFFGKRFRRNQLVLVSIAAANRDPEANPDPDVFDVTRTDPKHVAFGHGIHLCLGMTLARLEAKVAFETLLERYPNMQMVESSQAWQVNNFVRGLASMSVDLNGGSRTPRAA